MQLAAIVVMVSGIVVITDPSTLGVSAETWNLIGGWTAIGAAVLTGAATILRANQIPGVTTGIGNEIQGTVQTTTVSQETTTTP
jgi:hypothetical protein